MADSNSPPGVLIPGAGQSRKKTYSVSLREKSFNISEVPVDVSLSSDVHDDQNVDEKCQTCGQSLLQKNSDSFKLFKSKGMGGESQLSGSLPAQYEGNQNPRRSDYESLNHSSSDNPQETGLDHCHEVQFSQPNTKARNKLILASILCLVFMVGEIVGGYLANSLAIATDAAHLLTDFASFMISLFSLWVATRPRTKTMSFGWYRAEVIGALTSVLMIWVVTGILVYLAIQRLINTEFDINAKVMLITSGIGVIINIVMGLTLHQHGHSHGGLSGHSHGASDAESHPLLSHGHSHNQLHERENINVRAAFVHVMGDLIQSTGVFTAALVIYFKVTFVLAIIVMILLPTAFSL